MATTHQQSDQLEVTSCQMCGRDTTRLFGDEDEADHCAVCTLYSLSAGQENAATALRMISATVVDAIAHEGVAADDIRRSVHDALDYAVRTHGDGIPLAEISAKLHAHEELLRAEVA